MKQVQQALSSLSIPVFAGIWRATSSNPNAPEQYLVYSTTTREETHFDDQVVATRTFVYLNLWSVGDPTSSAALVREAMYNAGFGMVEETDRGYNQPAYDVGTRMYTVDYISGRALREMEPASKMYGKLVALSKAAVEGLDVSGENLTIPEALDTMVKWFCILFGGQFSPDDVYDHYPADRLMHDIALAIMAVQTQTTEVLDSFPTKPVAQEAQEILESQAP